MDKAVILARGLGTRMRNPDARARMSQGQETAADSGIKAMIPVGRPFLDHVMNALADAGFRKICLVIGPEARFDPIRNYYGSLATERVAISFAVQDQPKGTADAVAAARTFVGNDSFAVINSDNYYPTEALSMLGTIDTSGTIAFEEKALAQLGNIPFERIKSFAVLEPDEGFFLKKIIEKPTDGEISSIMGDVYVSMNCWRFSPSIFEACRRIEPSVRGEYEIASAVEYAMNNLGERFRMIPVKLWVLDMTGRSDIEAVDSLLRNRPVYL